MHADQAPHTLRPRRLHVPLLTCATLALANLPSAAHAYKCTRVPDSSGDENGASLAWFQRTLRFSLFAQGTNDIAGDEEFAALRLAFAQWGTLLDANGVAQNGPPTECVSPNRTTDLTFQETSALSTTDAVGYNFLLSTEQNENLLIFRDDAWPHSDKSALTIALTTTSFNALTGEIFDADIEFNSASFDFSTGDDVGPGCGASCETDLLNTTVHEVGHFLGLGHPSKSDATETDKDATMAAEATAGETEKRDLACDDKNAIVFKYPADSTNGYCETTVSASCGLCAPPDTLTASALIAAGDPNDGLGGCACGAATFHPGLCLLLALARLRTRRRPCS